LVSTGQHKVSKCVTSKAGSSIQLSLYNKSERNKRLKANHLVSCARKKGILTKPDSCEQCGQTKGLVAHHHDYSKPLDVIWLCHSCHMSQNVPNHKIRNRFCRLPAERIGLKSTLDEWADSIASELSSYYDQSPNPKVRSCQS